MRVFLTALLLVAPWGCAAPVGGSIEGAPDLEEKIQDTLSPDARVAVLRLANELPLQELVDDVSLPHHAAVQLVDYRDEDLDGFTTLEELLSLDPVNASTVQLLNRHAEQRGLVEMEPWRDGLPEGPLTATFKLTLAMADSSGECTSLRHCPIEYSTTQAGCSLGDDGLGETTITCWDDDTLAPRRLEAMGVIFGSGAEAGAFEMMGGASHAEPFIRGYIKRHANARQVVIQKYVILYADSDGESRMLRLSLYPVQVPLRVDL